MNPIFYFHMVMGAIVFSYKSSQDPETTLLRGCLIFVIWPIILGELIYDHIHPVKAEPLPETPPAPTEPEPTVPPNRFKG